MSRRFVPLLAAIAAALLPGSPARSAPGAGPAAPDSAAGGVSADLPVTDGTVLYVRYGQPGAVRIVRRTVTGDSLSMAEAARRDSTAVEAATAAPSAVASAVPTRDAALQAAALPQEQELAARVRRILREEIRASQAASGGGPQPPAGAPAPSASGWLDAPVGAGLPLGRAEPSRTPADRTWEITRTRPSTDSLAATPADSGAASAPDRPEASAAPARVPVTSLTTTTTVPSRTFVTESLVEGGLFRTNVVLFETSRDALLPRSREVLDVVADVLRDFPEVRIRVEGHADARGSAAANLELSRRRADSVRRYLIDEGGVPAGRLTAEGYGESRPLETGTGPTALALNRRVEFHVLNPEALRRVTGP